MNATNTMLAALRDVTGVEGSFYATRDGQILARDMPKIYDGDSFDGVATRLGRMLDALAELGGTNEGTLIRHPHHALFVRPTEHGMLGVLTTADVNVPSLKRGASLVARRLPVPATIDAAAAAPREAVPPSSDFTPVPSGLPLNPSEQSGASRLPQATITFPGSAPPPLPASAQAMPPPLPQTQTPPTAQRASSPGSRPAVQRTSVPGAPSTNPATAVRWRGSTLKE